MRVGVLFLLLVAVCGWAAKKLWWRHERKGWKQTLAVKVVLLRRGQVPAEALEHLTASLPRLEEALRQEFLRYRGESAEANPLDVPFSFSVHGPVPVSEAPPEVPEDDGLIARSVHFVRLWRYLAKVHERGHLRLGGHSMRIYVVVEPVRTPVRFVEGYGAVGGDFGIVHTVLDDTLGDQALIAIAHELLHCFGATDKYDEHGHALDPEGLAEPGLGYPQRYAEVMVGEVPFAPKRGRLAESLGQMRVGPATAREVGWLAR